MRAVIQRVSQAKVTVNGNVSGQIDQGMLVLLGVEVDDQGADLEYVLKKTVNLRIFDDPSGKMNVALKDIGGKMLVVSQFTLLGDVRDGNRPSYIRAAPPDIANQMYESFVERVRSASIEVETGVFRANMQVSLINDGPVTIIIDSRNK